MHQSKKRKQAQEAKSVQCIQIFIYVCVCVCIDNNPGGDPADSMEKKASCGFVFPLSTRLYPYNIHIFNFLSLFYILFVPFVLKIKFPFGSWD